MAHGKGKRQLRIKDDCASRKYILKSQSDRQRKLSEIIMSYRHIGTLRAIVSEWRVRDHTLLDAPGCNLAVFLV